MKIIGWTNWDNNYSEISNEEYDEARKVIIHELKENGYKWSGYYHQRGNCGVPVFDNDTVLRVSMRGWGKIMAEAEGYTDQWAYTRYAWSMPEDEKMITPEGELDD